MANWVTELRSRAAVTAVEIDRGLLRVLRETVEPEGVTVVGGDAMALDWNALLGEGPWVLVANLPYNVATPLIADLLASGPREHASSL